MKVKLICSKIENYPVYEETLITEIPERVFVIDGYHVADRLLEGVMFSVYFDESGKVLKVDIEDVYSKKYFEDNFNSKKWYKAVKDSAKDILDEGDEVDVPKSIRDKYFKNGINCAGIVFE